MSNQDGSWKTKFNLGFYFDIKFAEDWWFHPAVQVLSQQGIDNLNPYPTGYPEVDDVANELQIDRQLNYYRVPLMVRYHPGDRWYFDLGIEPALRGKSHDFFYLEIEPDDEFAYKTKISDITSTLDFGFTSGIAYKLSKKRLKSMKLGVTFYNGIVDVITDDAFKEDPSKKSVNRYFQIAVTIPIGAGEAAKPQEELPEN